MLSILLLILTSIPTNADNNPPQLSKGYSNDEIIQYNGWKQKYVEVKYVGDNIYNGDYKEHWPVGFYDNKVNKLSSHLPWMESETNNVYEAWNWADHDANRNPRTDKQPYREWENPYWGGGE